MSEDELIALAVKHKLGRTMKPLGMQTGDVFVTDQSYRTGELLTFAAAVAADERERSKVLAVWAHNALGVLATLEAEDMEDGGEQLRLLRDRGEKLVKAVLHG